TSPKNGMLAIGCQVVVHPRYIGVPRKVDRRIEAKSLRVQPISRREIVRDWILLEDRQHRRIGAFMRRIERNLGGGVKGNDLARSIHLVNDTIAQIHAGDRPENGCITGVAPGFPIRKEEEPVFYYRPPSRSAEHVSNQLGPRYARV